MEGMKFGTEFFGLER